MMSSEKHTEYFDELILRYLSGNSTNQEEDELLSWIKHDLQNEKYFQQMSDVWYISSYSKTNNFANPQKAYNKFIVNKKRHGSFKIRKLVYFAAASLLLLISVLGLTNLKLHKKVLFSENKTISYTLPDGSEVSLNQYSSLVYYSKLFKSQRFSNIKGEVYFNVMHDRSHPFVVISDNILITVTGTTFNVKSDADLLEISLVEGSVSVGFIDAEKSRELKAGESVMLNKTLKTMDSSKPMDYNNITWKTNELVFKNTDLKDVISRIEKLYDITIQYDPSTITTFKFDGSLKSDDLELILNTLELTFNLNFVPAGEKKYTLNTVNSAN
jgi:transmembrane sensor